MRARSLARVSVSNKRMFNGNKGERDRGSEREEQNYKKEMIESSIVEVAIY